MLELSSFQTADLDASPSVGVLLNLYREHTDWHLTERTYWDDKLNLFAHRPDMVSVLNRRRPARCASGGPRCPNPRWFRAPEGFDVGPGGHHARRAALRPARRPSRCPASTTSTTSAPR